MRITEFTVGTSRTINLGNFESLRIEASVTIDVEDTDNEDRVHQQMDNAQIQLRKLLEDTYRAQTKAKPEKVA